jgi:Tol biopolymer transport system component
MKAESPVSRVESQRVAQGKRRGARARRKSRRLSYRRRLGFEPLEERRMLAVVIDVASIVALPSDGSVTAGGGSSNHYYEGPNAAVSADGRYIAFISNAPNLVTGYSLVPNVDNIYRYDRLTGEMVLVSVDVTGHGSGNSNSYYPAISADGNIVVFESRSTNLHPFDTNSSMDIFARYIAEGATQLVSVNEFGNGSGYGDNVAPTLSADGKIVAFRSTSPYLDPLDRDTNWDIYARNMTTGRTDLVTVNAAGTGPGNDVNGYYDPVVSADGSTVAFVSDANDLVASANNPNSVRNVFARDLITHTTVLVSVNAAGTSSANESSAAPTISANGRFIAFTSYANDIDPLDTDVGRGDNTVDVFVRDLMSNVTKLISVNSDGTGSGNDESDSPEISANGDVVAFVSSANNLTPIAGGDRNVYVRNISNGTTLLVTLNSSGTGGNNGIGSWYPHLSADGQIIAFQSFANNLSPLDADPDPENDADIYVHNVDTGTTQLVSVNYGGTNAGNGQSFEPSISADGSTVVFLSDASDLVRNDVDNSRDVFAARVSWPSDLLHGDYDGNGVVDAADHDLWVSTFGSVGDLRADGNGNGIVDAADYTVWRDHFGEAVAAGAGSGAVAGGVERGAGSEEELRIADVGLGFGESADVGAASGAIVVQDPHPLDNSRPLPRGAVSFEAAPAPMQFSPRPALGALGVPLGAAISRSEMSTVVRDAALLVWLAGREEPARSMGHRAWSEVVGRKAEGGGGKADGVTRDESAVDRVRAVDDVLTELAVGV